MGMDGIAKDWNDARTDEQRRHMWEKLIGPYTRGLFLELLDDCSNGNRASLERWLTEPDDSKKELIQFGGPRLAEIFRAHLLCALAVIEHPDPVGRCVPAEVLRRIAEATKTSEGLLRDLVWELYTPVEKLALISPRILCGELREPIRTVTTPAMFAEGMPGSIECRGVVGWLTLDLVRDGDGGCHPIPALAFLELGPAFLDSEHSASEYLRVNKLWLPRCDFRWWLERRDDVPLPSQIDGPSLGSTLAFSQQYALNGVPAEKMEWIDDDLHSIAFKAQVAPDGRLLPVGQDYIELVAAASSSLFPRIHTVVISYDQPWERFHLDPDPLNRLFLRDPTRDFHVIRARTMSEAIDLLVVNAQTRWRPIDCAVPTVESDHLPRPELHQMARDMIGEKGSGYVVAIGGTGEGKSTLCHDLIREDIAQGKAPVYHLIEHQRPETSNLRNIAACLYYRLVRKYPVEIAAQLEKLDIEPRLQHLLTYLSEHYFKHQKEPEVIYIEAADQSDASVTQPLLPGTLRRLPEGVVCFITARPGLETWLQDFDQVKPWEWDPELHREDIRRYLEKEAMHVSPPLKPAFIKRIVENRDEPPNFLTVKNLLDILKRPNGDKTLQQRLRKEPGLWRKHPETQVREEILRSMRKAQRRGVSQADFLGTLGLLAVSRESLSQRDLRQLELWQDNVTEFVLGCAANLFRFRRDLFSPAMPYRFYHPGYAREVLKLLEEMLDGGEANSHGRLADACARWRGLKGEARAYAVRHLPTHLRLAGRADEAGQVLIDLGYLEERMRRQSNGAGGHHPAPVYELLDDFQETLYGGGAIAQDQALRDQLDSLDRLLDAHAPELNEDPSLFVQLAYNRLAWRWDKHSSLGSQLEQAAARHGQPWLKSLVPRQDSFVPEPQRKLPGHRGPVRSVAFSSDGALLASAGGDNTVRVWDSRTGRLLHQLIEHQREATCVAFSPAEDTLVTGSYDGMLRFYAPESGSLLQEAPSNAGGIHAVAFSDDGQWLSVGCYGHKVGVWDMFRNCWLWEKHVHTHQVDCVAFAPGGQRLASGSKDGRVIVWDTLTGATICEFDAHSTWVHAIAFSPPDGRCLVTGGGHGKGEIKFWNPDNGDHQRTTITGPDGVSALAFSLGGAMLASGSYDETIRIVDPQTGALLLPPMGNGGAVHSLACSPNGPMLASTSFDGSVLLWDVQMPASEATQPTNWQEVGPGRDPVPRAMAFANDGKTLLVGCSDKTLRLRDVFTSKPKGAVTGFAAPVVAIAVVAGGCSVVCGTDREIGVWNGRLEDAPRVFRGHGQGLLCLAVDRDGRLIVTGGHDKLALLWESSSGQCLRTFESHTGAVTAVVIARNGRIVATGSDDARVLLWDVEAAEPKLTLTEHRNGITVLAFSTDENGRMLASGDRDGSVRLWNSQTGESIFPLLGHTGEITAAAFATDGLLLATGSADDTVRIWNIATGKQMACLPCSHRVRALWFEGGSPSFPVLHAADVGGATHIPNTYVVEIQNMAR